MRSIAPVDELLQDVRYALRAMRNNLGVTVLAVTLLALGIGANTAVFSLLDAILLKSLPVPAPDRLVVLHVEKPSAARSPAATRFSYPTLDRLMASSEGGLDGLFTWQLYAVALGTEGQKEATQEATQAAFVSGSYFPALQISPRAGRLIQPADNVKDDAHAVVVISDGLWERRFGRSGTVVGQMLRINGYPFTIVGIAPAGFFGVDVGAAPDLWMPLRTMSMVSLPGVMLDNRDAFWLPAMARLKPGVTPQQAADALAPVYDDTRRVQGGPKATLAHERLELLPGANGISRLRQQFATPIVVIMILVVLILTIACANLANLQLARAIARSKEVAIRLAIGASQGRLVRQLLTESVVLSVMGAAAGLLLARVSLRLLVATLPAMRDLEVGIDARVLAFCGAVALGTALLFGLAPVWMMRRVDVGPVLKDEMASTGRSARRGWLRHGLVVAQIALTIVLVFGASLFVYTLRNLRSADTGLQTERVLQLTVNAGQRGATASQRRAQFQRILDGVRSVPGVRAAAFAGDELLSGRVGRMDIFPPEYRPAPNEDVYSIGMTVDPGLFRTLGIPVHQGRDFTLQDTADAPKVAIMNEAAARYFFQTGTPIGRHIGIGGKPDLEVIGVVGNTKFRDLREPMARIVYLPLSQLPGGPARTLYVNTDSDPTRLAGSIRQTIQATAREALVHNIKRFSAQIDESLAQERVTAWLSSFFGVLALIIATLGLYGLMAYTVSRRTREIGVRMALGASPGSVIWMVFRESMMVASAGALLGLLIAVGGGVMLSSLLYGVTARDPTAMLLAAGALLITAALASYLPARRAAAIDPLKALRG